MENAIKNAIKNVIRSETGKEEMMKRLYKMMAIVITMTLAAISVYVQEGSVINNENESVEMIEEETINTDEEAVGADEEEMVSIDQAGAVEIVVENSGKDAIKESPEYVEVNVPKVEPKPEVELTEEQQQQLKEATAEGYMPVDILIQNSYLKVDTDAFIFMDRVYAPLRFVVEAFGMTDIEWNEERQVATMTGHGYALEFKKNTPEVKVNDEIHVLDTPVISYEGRMMVPLSFLSELLGFETIWDQTYYTVGLIHPTYVVEPEYLDNRFYTYGELQNFAKLVMREAGSTSYEAHHGVASVIVNRISHQSFGKSVDGVIFNKDWSVQFPPAHKSNFQSTKPNEKAVKAAKYTLRGENSVGDSIYFNNRAFKGKPIYKIVDGIYFMK